MHSSTKYSPNKVFYSDDENLFKNVLYNIKSSFKDRGTIEANFIAN